MFYARTKYSVLADKTPKEKKTIKEKLKAKDPFPRHCVRCSAIKADGKQCTRQTCKYAGMCWQHTKSIKGLQIRSSQIPGGGMGLWATREFHGGEKIAEFGGVVKKSEKEVADVKYAVQIGRNRYSDHLDPQSGLARWANDCREANVAKGNCPGNNAIIHNEKGPGLAKIEVEDDADPILRGQEIFVDYGDEYWVD